MPRKPPKPCGRTGCGELTYGTYCDKHQQEADRDYNHRQRDRTAQSFYESTAWRRVRRIKLSDSPLCEECKRGGTLVAATVVDHIMPIRQGGAKLEMDNLQSLCQSCHSRKSALEGSRWGKA